MGFMKDLDRRIRQGGDDAIAAVGELLPRWVHVSERLPQDGQRVLSFFRCAGVEGAVCEALFDEQTGLFVTPICGYRASHWQPLPEPPSL